MQISFQRFLEVLSFLFFTLMILEGGLYALPLPHPSPLSVLSISKSLSNHSWSNWYGIWKTKICWITCQSCSHITPKKPLIQHVHHLGYPILNVNWSIFQLRSWFKTSGKKNVKTQTVQKFLNKVFIQSRILDGFSRQWRNICQTTVLFVSWLFLT